jgi:hypothetical protein
MSRIICLSRTNEIWWLFQEQQYNHITFVWLVSILQRPAPETDAHSFVRKESCCRRNIICVLEAWKNAAVTYLRRNLNGFRIHSCTSVTTCTIFWDPSPFSADAKNTWSCNSTPYVFIVCCLVNHVDNFTIIYATVLAFRSRRKE